jgi:3-oxoadipate enol-lactonase
MNIETGFTDINGANMYYEVAGDGTPLVFVHGYALDRRMWDDQFEFFATRYRAVRYDLRGFGRSDVPTAGRFSNHDDLRRLFDHLGIERAHICGLSMGGGVAIDFALEYPDRVLSVIGIASALGGFTVDFGPMIPAMIAMQTAGREGNLAEAKRIWIESPLFVPANRDPAVAQRLGEMVDDWSGWQLTNQANHVDPDPPPAERLDQLSVPALVINGGLDNEGVLGVAVEIEAKAPNARRVVVPGAGHLTNMEAPDAVNDLIASFLMRKRLFRSRMPNSWAFGTGKP